MSSLQWSPVLETGNTAGGVQGVVEHPLAAMEPGLRDREYMLARMAFSALAGTLQWSPVLETGNTS